VTSAFPPHAPAAVGGPGLRAPHRGRFFQTGLFPWWPDLKKAVSNLNLDWNPEGPLLIY
jgi:hypothetical protein